MNTLKGRASLAIIVAVAAIAVILIVPRAARADLAPQDACTSPGQPCMNAAPDYHTDGTCTESTCLRTVPDGDGGVTTMEYACNLCKASASTDAGSDDAATDGHPIDEVDTGVADGASEGSGGGDSGCSCAFASGPHGRGGRNGDAFGLAAVALGVAVATVHRTRRRGPRARR